MNKRSSAPARIVAVIVLIAAFVVVVVVFAGALGGDSGGSDGHGHGRSGHHARRAKHKAPKSYVVESGDTLISIAHQTGVSVARIEELNPEVDPQILIAGETLKLR
jgi:LysM domain